MPKCTICTHAEVELITASIARIGTRKTARRFSLSRSSVNRHKQHLLDEKVPPRFSRGTNATLSHRQVDFVEGLAEGKTVRGAARDAGYTPETALVAHKSLPGKTLAEMFHELLPKPGRVAQRIEESLDAVKLVEVKRGKMVERPDYTERRRAAELILKLRGLMAQARSSTVTVGVAVNVGTERPEKEADLDAQVAEHVAQATCGYDLTEFKRLKRVWESTKAAVN